MRYRQRGPLASLTRLIVLLLLAIATVARGPLGLGRRLARRNGPGAAVRHDDGHRLPPGAGLAAGRRGGADRRAWPSGTDCEEFVLLMGVTTAAVLNLGRIRTRSKLIHVGLFAGGVAVLLYVGDGHDRRSAAGSGRC